MLGFRGPQTVQLCCLAPFDVLILSSKNFGSVVQQCCCINPDLKVTLTLQNQNPLQDSGALGPFPPPDPASDLPVRTGPRPEHWRNRPEIPRTPVHCSDTHTHTHGPLRMQAEPVISRIWSRYLSFAPQPKHRARFDPTALSPEPNPAARARSEPGHHPMRQRGWRLSVPVPAAESVRLPAQVLRLLRVSVSSGAASRCGSAGPGPAASRRSGSVVALRSGRISARIRASAVLSLVRSCAAFSARTLHESDRGWRQGGVGGGGGASGES